jgi:hypothetical protein
MVYAYLLVNMSMHCNRRCATKPSGSWDEKKALVIRLDENLLAKKLAL